MTHTTKYGNLYATSLSPEWHEKTAAYWYTVTSGATAHTAFATRKGLDRWLEERGLTLESELPETRGTPGMTRILGEYYEMSHGEFAGTEDNPYRMVADDAWYQIRPTVITAAMSNGNYTLALITEDDDRTRTVHTLNPGVKDRIQVEDFPGYIVMRRLMS